MLLNPFLTLNLYKYFIISLVSPYKKLISHYYIKRKLIFFIFYYSYMGFF